MISIFRGGGRLLLVAIASGAGVWASSMSRCDAADDGPANPGPGRKALRFAKRQPTNIGSGRGTLGYGPPGLHPGFQGFGLGYHLGYGYGGAALGVGAHGGYPFYGGPGYPHPWPSLTRAKLLTIEPFSHYGGPGGPSPDHPNYFGAVGPLAPDRPVVLRERNPTDPPESGEYGDFTGTIPYPESAFAPFETISGPSGSSSGTSNVAPPPNPSSNPPSNRSFGVDGEPVPDAAAGGVLGLKILGILPGSVAEKAGLRVGDVILSINGSLTQRSSDLFQILENAATNNALKIKVRTATDGKLKDITVQLA